MKTTCYFCKQERICCDSHGTCEDCEGWEPWSCFTHVVRSFKLKDQRGDIGVEQCAWALVVFFLAFIAFHIGTFVARRGDSLITFILKAAGL